ncbi:MAG: RraA family protein [Thermodesulfobacteriota bacterium]
MTESSEKLQTLKNTLRDLTTGMIADALLISGINGGVMGVRPARGFEDIKIAGPAVTVRFSPPRPGEKIYTNYEVIRNADPGSVLVIDGRGFDGHFTGDNQAACAKKQGLEAIVVDGGARDLAGFRQAEIPLYCKGSATRDKPAEFKITAFNVPVEIGGVPVRPGDIIVADEDGVVVIPLNFLDGLMENMKTINTVEKEMEQAIQGNAPVEKLKEIISKKKPKKS